MSNSAAKRPVIAHVNPKSPISEAYRALRTNIQFSDLDQNLRVIMVTSAGPAEGKSTTAANLAVTYAQADKKVLLVDCDMRKPSVHQTFRLSNRHGLSSVLSHQCGLEEIIADTQIPNLSAITSGPVPPNPSEMLASERFSKVLTQLKEKFDFIILDTPPALVVTDAQLVASKCDGTLLVIHSGKVKKDAAIKVKANLEKVGARTLGVVLNNVDRRKGEDYYYYYYGVNN